MKIFKKLGMRQGDDGAALAMVLVFIVVLGLWMASLAVLTQTSTASLAKNTEENVRRAQIVNSILPRAISELNYPVRLGMDEDQARCDEHIFRTSENPGILTYAIPTKTKTGYVSESVKVECIQAIKSGTTQPVASFLLTGGMPASGTGVTGQDGGLKLDKTGGQPLVVTGGITNVSGAWENVDATTLQLKKVCANTDITDVTQCEGDPAPQIIQPSDSKCPALFYTIGSCVCPSWSSSNPVIPSSNCPVGTEGSSFDNLNPQSDATELRAYIDSISAPLESVFNNASIPNSCNVTDTVNGSSLFAVQVSPGLITASTLAKLNALTISSSCGDGKTVNSPALQFLPGIYRFNFSAAGSSRSLSGQSINALQFNTNGLKIIGGIPKFNGTEWNCDPSAPGVQFQFENGSYMTLAKGSVSLCPLSPSKPVLAAPWSTGEVAPFSWSGSRTDPIFENTSCGSAGGGASSNFYSYGQIFVPAGFLKLCFNGNSSMTMAKGVVAKAVTLSVTGSAQSSGTVAPPRPYNGDRVVQLRFWSNSRKQDLGLVQVVIRDYFGRRQGAGYKIIAWRTIW